MTRIARYTPSGFSRLLKLLLITLPLGFSCAAQGKPEPDLLVLSNGDTLHGKFVNEVGGKVAFHSDPLGDLSIGWDKIKELHTAGKFAVLDKNVKLRGKKNARQIPEGNVDVSGQAVTVHTEGAAPVAPIPVKNAQYIVDGPTLDKQLFHEPSFFAGWNGAATAGATLVKSTQNQYTVSGGVGLVRVVPTVSWLDPRNRTSADFTGSYGKITQPGTPEHQIRDLPHRRRTRSVRIIAVLRSRSDGLRPQLRPGPATSADLWRRIGMDGDQNR